MARTFTGGERSAIAAAHVNQHWYAEVKDTGGTWRHMGTLGGVDWNNRFEIGEDIDQRVIAGTVSFRREDAASGKSLAPLITASSLNLLTGSFSPLLYGGRRLRLWAAVTAPGVAPSSYKPMGEFKIDHVDWKSSESEIIVDIRDIGAIILDTWIEDSLPLYGSNVGTPALTVMQAILDNYPPPGGATIVATSAPAYSILTYQQDRKSVLEAINDIALQAAGDVRYRFDSGDNFTLQFLRPDRAKTVVDWTIGPTEYDDVTELSTGDADVRNAIRVLYTDAVTGLIANYTATSASSIGEFGRKFMELAEEATSRIDTAAEAQRMAEAARDDLSFPKADQEIKCRFFWPVQLYDLGGWTANGVHYDTDQKLAVIGFRHVAENGEIWTYIKTRGAPAGAFRAWLDKGRTPGTPEALGPIQINVVPDASDANTITVHVDTFAPGASVRPTIRVDDIFFNTSINTGPAVDTDSVSGTAWKFNRSTGASPYPGIVMFTAKLEGFDDVSFLWPVQDLAAFGPDLDVKAQPSGTTQYIITWSGDSVLLSIDGGAYGAPSASPITVTRDAADHIYAFQGTKNGQTVTNSVTVPNIEADTVTPDLTVTPGTPTTTTSPFTISASNPKPGGAAPTITMTFTNCTASGYVGAGPFTIASGTVVTVNRPAFQVGQATAKWRASISGGGAEEIQRTIPNVEQDTQQLVVNVKPLSPSGGTNRYAYRIEVSDPHDQGGSYIQVAYQAQSGLTTYDYGTSSAAGTNTLASGGVHDYESLMDAPGGSPRTIVFIVTDNNGHRVAETRTVTVPVQSTQPVLGLAIYDVQVDVVSEAANTIQASWLLSDPNNLVDHLRVRWFRPGSGYSNAETELGAGVTQWWPDPFDLDSGGGQTRQVGVYIVGYNGSGQVVGVSPIKIQELATGADI